MSEKLEKDLELEETEEVVEETELDEENTATEVELEEKTVSKSGEPSPLVGISLETYNELTNRSQDFMFQLNRLIEDEIVDTDLVEIYQEMVETLLETQSSGQTARQLYGTPTECAEVILSGDFGKEGEAKVVEPSNKLIAVDGGLAMGSIYTIIVGISMLNAKADQVQNATYMGVLSTIVSYIMAGVAMLITYKNMPDFDAPRGKKGYPKYFIMSILGMMLWFGAVTITTIVLPEWLNPVMPAWTYIVLGIVTFILRYFIRKTLNFEGGIF